MHKQKAPLQMERGWGEVFRPGLPDIAALIGINFSTKQTSVYQKSHQRNVDDFLSFVVRPGLEPGLF